MQVCILETSHAQQDLHMADHHSNKVEYEHEEERTGILERHQVLLAKRLETDLRSPIPSSSWRRWVPHEGTRRNLDVLSLSTRSRSGDQTSDRRQYNRTKLRVLGRSAVFGTRSTSPPVKWPCHDGGR